MTENIVQFEVRLPYTTGLPRDVSINTWNCWSSDIETLDTAAATSAIADFYNSDAGTDHGTAVADWLSPILSRATNAAEIRTFVKDLATGVTLMEGAPLFFTLGPLGGSVSSVELPYECSVCCSFAADYGSLPEHSGSTRPRARHRGRIFLGPYSISALLSSGALVNNLLVDDMASAAHRTVTALTAADLPLQVWSRANHARSPVTKGWVDNEFDTQRRRQVPATTRNTWPA